MQGKNGIRETFGDLNAPGDLLKPGKFGTYASGLVLVKKYADDGLAALNAATSFPFTFGCWLCRFQYSCNFQTV